MQREPAIVLAIGYFRKLNAKTAHALVRSSERFDVLGVVDPDATGQDAGQLLDRQERGISIFDTVGDAVAALERRPIYCIVGVATPGGVLPDVFRASLLEALDAGMALVNGLHQLLADDEEIAARAAVFHPACLPVLDGAQ